MIDTVCKKLKLANQGDLVLEHSGKMLNDLKVTLKDAGIAELSTLTLHRRGAGLLGGMNNVDDFFRRAES